MAAKQIANITQDRRGMRCSFVLKFEDVSTSNSVEIVTGPPCEWNCATPQAERPASGQRKLAESPRSAEEGKGERVKK